MQDRADLIAAIRDNRCPDILIIGGGINGAGTFRDLAAQGVPTLLVEAGDFSSGTSSAPSRLIHGGLRYLETGEPSLVRESLVERNLLLKNARHVVHPLPIWVPLKSWLGGAVGAGLRFLGIKRSPGRKGAVPVKIGLMIYDMFGRKHKSMPDHRLLSAKKARAEMPALAPDVRAVAEYYDARITHPERLVMELIADGETDCEGAMGVPYLAAVGTDQGGVTLEDRLTGEQFTVTPRIVINAAGPWVDKVQGNLGIDGRLMGGTRGTHLVIRNPGLASDLGGRMLYFETDDFRACLALPLDAENTYVGTTDIRTDDPDDRSYTEEEIDYIFSVLRPVLPDVNWTREDIVFVMAGIRPLPYQDASVGAAGEISRDHRLDRFPKSEDRPFDTFTLVGGKWTTYRAFAEEITDTILGEIDAGRAKGTDTLPIGGARGLPEKAADRAEWIKVIADKTGLPSERIKTLASRYGGRAEEFAEAEARQNDQFDALTGYTPAEILMICQSERVSRLEDVVLRRTLMAFEGKATKAAVEAVSKVVATALGWDEAARKDQVDATLTLLAERFRVPLDA